MSKVTRSSATRKNSSRETASKSPAQEAHIDQQTSSPAVLVLNGDVNQLAELTHLLEVNGCEVISCRSATEALDSLTARPVDVLVTDTWLPGVSGFELVRKVRRMRVSNRKSRLLPVIAMSGNGNQSSRAALESGANAFVEKRDLSRKLPEQIRTLAG